MAVTRHGGLETVTRRGDLTRAAGCGVTADSGVWISEPTGMMGYVECFTLATLAPEQATLAEGTNGIRARLAGGALS